MNRIDELFKQKKERILSIYFTAGFPKLGDTLTIMEAIESAGADIIEIGVPYSDPIADGPTIQESNNQALKNGMTLKLLFEQLKKLREKVSIPVILMGYLNPVVQYGMEAFCKKCKEVGIDGLILPDLPMQQYLSEYKALFDTYDLRNTFLISPQTAEERIRQIDQHTDGFIYMVSSASITGAKKEITPEQVAYFERVKAMKLNNPRLIGFGISDKPSFQTASAHSHGAIIGSAFINVLRESTDLKKDIYEYIQGIIS
ncbi:tryptophan synthase subunit alpha [Cyclobacterium jeungdonense]|uniref:Tryptophan synthase alpha chain n=1 Tax=Cyclobacterium jeungdonense TaxID=708087 RepID=A0ABT8C9T4_9BACT|nr:tryptophan synthase subunit alpha [Cyclobacterium jeungdonense]MDN3688426.1 tryptophan synthase subunit alpha [Cyclobacterium jeungdonense]